MNKTLKITQTALLFAAACILSWLESLIPMPTFLVGIKLGLSNIIIMYCLFYMGKKDAFILCVLKSLFAFLTRGVTSGLLSFSGGVISILSMMLVLFIFKDKISMLMVSVIGGIMHNTAQLAVACIITQTLYTLYYYPVLLLFGTIAGILTGIILNTVMPALKRIKS